MTSPRGAGIVARPRCNVVLAVLAASLVVLGAPVVARADVAPTTTVLTVSPTQTSADSPITLAAQVSSDSGPPTGSVTFYDNSVLLSTATLSPVAGSTTTAVAQTTTRLPGGTTASLQASYESNSLADFTNSTSVAVTEQVGNDGPTATTTRLTTSVAGEITTRQAVTLRAHVSSSADETPTGQVAFLENGLLLGTAQLDQSGTATLVGGGLAQGIDTVEADYSGDDSDATSSGSLSIVVASPAGEETSTTALAVSTAHTITSAETVTLTAHVAVHGTTPASGTVEFRINGVLLGTAPLTPAGAARLVTGGFLAGSETVEADYPGARSIAPSSAAVTFAVTVSSRSAHPTTTTLATSTARTISARQSVTLTARVAAPGAPSRPAGVVAFSDNGVVLGTAPLDANGRARFTTGGFLPGEDTIEADYRGSSGYQPSITEVTVVVQRSRAVTVRTGTRTHH